MMKFKVGAATIVLLLGTAWAANADNYGGPGFSGSAWTNGDSGKVENMGTVHVGAAGFLMNIKSQGQSVSSLFKWDSEIIWSLMHDQKMYMEIPPEEQSGWEAYENKACMGYESGEKQGSETVNGRSTEKWRCTGPKTPEGETATDSTVWYDPELEFAIKSIDDNGDVFEVRDIQIGAQDASMFEIPAGYTKFDMNAMMQQMMQQGQQ